jgi:hypothetical protein
MPNDVTLYQCWVWFNVGLFTLFGGGLGWHMAGGLIKLLNILI